MTADVGPDAHEVGPDDGGHLDGEHLDGEHDDGPGWSWYLVRVSGLFLAVLLPLHFAVVIIRDDVGRSTLSTVTARFTDARWQAVELVTIVLALLHGFLALRAVTVSSGLSAAAKTRVVAGLGVVAVLLVLATVRAMLSLS